ncbi:hypothetical protein ACHAWF_005292 [Thalassiosira exigua]
MNLRGHRRRPLPLPLLLLLVATPRPTSSLSTSPSISPGDGGGGAGRGRGAMPSPSPTGTTGRLVTIAERTWRSAASRHVDRIRTLLEPGLTDPDHPINSGRRDRRRRRRRKDADGWTALDPANPVYNFLIEYYGLKGAKGPRRLARWAPDPGLLLDDGGGDGRGGTTDFFSTSSPRGEIYDAAMLASDGLGGVFLEGATRDDLGGTLHLRGGVPVPASVGEGDNGGDNSGRDGPPLHGVLYHPGTLHGLNSLNGRRSLDDDGLEREKALAPYRWYASVLKATLASEPILHCHGLHEWAMQYHPPGADPPPSAKYQSGLNLRVSRDAINETVERKGIRCTHVDALRFFAPAAGPLNRHGRRLERMDQLRLEQKGCVHAHMDLLKICLKIRSHVSSELLGDVLEVALAARTLDVGASPYDASRYGVTTVPVETAEGRRAYREAQVALMGRAEPARRRLLDAYGTYGRLAFGADLAEGSVGGVTRDDGAEDDEGDRGDARRSQEYADPERFAVATPGGLPWRKSLVPRGGGTRQS